MSDGRISLVGKKGISVLKLCAELQKGWFVLVCFVGLFCFLQLSVAVL